MLTSSCWLCSQAVGTGQWDLWNTFSGQANSNLAALCAFAAINGFGAAILATSWPAGDRMVTLGDGWNTLQPCQVSSRALQNISRSWPRLCAAAPAVNVSIRDATMGVN